jgi:hypothetical protein
LFLHPMKLCANWTLYVYLCVPLGVLGARDMPM